MVQIPLGRIHTEDSSILGTNEMLNREPSKGVQVWRTKKHRKLGKLRFLNTVKLTRMSQEVSKWFVNGLFHLLINGVYWGYNPLTNHLVNFWYILV